ncbi:MAG TPA: hypothetical protein VF407_10205 [Polyangiaceae bacterium]
MSDLRQERDRVAARPIVLVGAAALIATVVSAVVAILFLRAHPDADDARTPEPSTPQIGIVEQTIVEKNAPGIVLEQRQRRSLGEWRYLDDKHEAAEIPIDRAMQIVEERHR